MKTASTTATRSWDFDAEAPAWSPAAGERVVVYGAGAFARVLARAIRKAGGDVVCALDRRAETIGALDGIPVYRPGMDPLSVSERASTVVALGVFNREADVAAIEAMLGAQGYARVVGPPELYESFGADLGSRFWLAPRSFYASRRHDASAVVDLWADATSRKLYESLLRYRLFWNPADAPVPAEGEHYFPRDLPRKQGAMRFVDCGAFVGDTLAEIAQRCEPLEQVYAFEPDIRHFARLSFAAARIADSTEAHVLLWPCAVAARSQVLRFQTDAGEAGCLASDGDAAVTAVALDDVLPTANPTDVKMDIEGAELDALRGAERLIRRAVPRLAICVYHRPEHLWEIPLFVRSLGLPYDFHLRSHGHLGFDVVMYAVPRHL